MQNEETDPQTASDAAPVSLSAVVTTAFEPSGQVAGIAFAPRANEPWTGLIAANLSSGGFDIFNVNGERVIAASGPRLSGLAVAPDFALRGETLPLMFGADSDGQVRGFALSTQIEDVIELPLAPELNDGSAAGVCLFDVGIGYVEIAVLDREAQASVWRITDGGGETLDVQSRAEFDLPYAGRSCAADGDALLVAGPAAGLTRVDLTGAVEARIEAITLTDLAVTELRGLPAVVAPSPQDEALRVYDARDLSVIADVVFEDGLNAPAFIEPATLSVSDASFGGMSFSSGLVAVYDSGDGRVKLVAREVLTRAVFTAG